MGGLFPFYACDAGIGADFGGGFVQLALRCIPQLQPGSGAGHEFRVLPVVQVELAFFVLAVVVWFPPIVEPGAVNAGLPVVRFPAFRFRHDDGGVAVQVGSDGFVPGRLVPVSQSLDQDFGFLGSAVHMPAAGIAALRQDSASRPLAGHLSFVREWKPLNFLPVDGGFGGVVRQQPVDHGGGIVVLVTALYGFAGGVADGQDVVLVGNGYGEAGHAGAVAQQVVDRGEIDGFVCHCWSPLCSGDSVLLACWLVWPEPQGLLRWPGCAGRAGCGVWACGMTRGSLLPEGWSKGGRCCDPNSLPASISAVGRSKVPRLCPCVRPAGNCWAESGG